MSHNELKIEIQRVLDNIPDAVLEEILLILKGIEAKSKETLVNDEYFKIILEEDKKLLQKL